MTGLVLAALFLPISHFGISSTSLRGALVARLGEKGYLGFYSLVTVIAFGWLIIAYRHAPASPLWLTPGPLQLLVAAVVFVGFLLVVVGVTTPNPTTVGADALFDRPDAVRGILRITRNPFLWGVGLWAIAHIIATGDLTDMILFSSIGALGWVGSLLIDAKKARQQGPRWERFASLTSNLPFAAIVQGRQQLVISEIGLWRIALAVAIFITLLLLHARLFGATPFPGW